MTIADMLFTIYNTISKQPNW